MLSGRNRETQGRGGRRLLPSWSRERNSKWRAQLGQRLPRRLSGKVSACQCRRCRRLRFDAWVRKIPWRRKWQPTPVFLLGESHRPQRLVDCSPWGHKELAVTVHTAHTLLGALLSSFTSRFHNWVVDYSHHSSCFYHFLSFFFYF